MSLFHLSYTQPGFLQLWCVVALSVVVKPVASTTRHPEFLEKRVSVMSVTIEWYSPKADPSTLIEKCLQYTHKSSAILTTSGVYTV